jgi:ferredoxin
MGHRCTLFEKNKVAGGLLHEARPGEDHYREALAREVKQILAAGIEFKPGIRVEGNLFKEILDNHDAVVLATGELQDLSDDWGVVYGKSGFQADRTTYRTSNQKIFAIGNAVRPMRSAVRSVGHGKEVAASVDQFINGQEVTGYPGMFNSRFGRLVEEEFAEYLKEAVTDDRVKPEKGETAGFNINEAREEASRCMHCDCRDIDTCLLRIFSDRHQADQKRFKRENRRTVTKRQVHDAVIYEESKCIKCGICVRLSEIKKEKFGFTYIGRGFDVRIGTPFDEKLKPELIELAEEAAIACPTGALTKINQH